MIIDALLMSFTENKNHCGTAVKSLEIGKMVIFNFQFFKLGYSQAGFIVDVHTEIEFSLFLPVTQCDFCKN